MGRQVGGRQACRQDVITQRLGAKYLRPWEVYAWAALGYLLIAVSMTQVGFAQKMFSAFRW